MKLQIITILLISLFVFGCTEIANWGTEEKNCVNDWNCFIDKLTYCEIAVVNINQEINLGSLPYQNRHFFTLPNSVAKIEDSGDGKCRVNFSEISEKEGVNWEYTKIDSKNVGDWSYYINTKNYSNVTLLFDTCQPNQEFKCSISPKLFLFLENR